MDGDDDMIVIIIGDDENEENQNNAIPAKIPIKEEPVDEHHLLDSKSILEIAELYGEYLNQIKEEYYDCEYLDDDFDREVNIMYDGTQTTLCTNLGWVPTYHFI